MDQDHEIIDFFCTLVVKLSFVIMASNMLLLIAYP